MAMDLVLSRKCFSVDEMAGIGYLEMTWLFNVTFLETMLFCLMKISENLHKNAKLVSQKKSWEFQSNATILSSIEINFMVSGTYYHQFVFIT